MFISKILKQLIRIDIKQPPWEFLGGAVSGLGVFTAAAGLQFLVWELRSHVKWPTQCPSPKKPRIFHIRKRSMKGFLNYLLVLILKNIGGGGKPAACRSYLVRDQTHTTAVTSLDP